MPANDEKPAKTLANLPLGSVLTALGPLSIVVWQGMAWAQEIESNVKANQAQIETLVEMVKANDVKDEQREQRTDRILDVIERAHHADEIGTDSTRPDPID